MCQKIRAMILKVVFMKKYCGCSINSQCIMQILLDDFNAKVGRVNIFEPTVGNESVHIESNDYDIR